MYVYLSGEAVYGPFDTEEDARADAAREMRLCIVHPFRSVASAPFPSARRRRAPAAPEAGSWAEFVSLGQ